MDFFQISIVGLAVIFSVFFLLGLKSQKGEAKGLMKGRLADCGASPNCVCSEPDTQPERAIAPIKSNLREIRAAIISTGGTITREQDGYISATYMSKVFKFVDDVEVREAGGGIMHIRSASRTGYSDRGANRRRVEMIRRVLTAS